MNLSDRKVVEAIKEANDMTISFSTGREHVTLNLRKDKKLFHDIALAYQTAIIQREREHGIQR